MLNPQEYNLTRIREEKAAEKSLSSATQIIRLRKKRESQEKKM